MVCTILLFLLQVSVSHRFSYGSLRFDMLYLLAAYLALEASPRGALWSALLIGVLRDLASCGRVGGSAVPLVLATIGMVFIRDRIYREHVLMDILLVFALVAFCGLMRAAGMALLARSAEWGTLAAGAIGQAFVTALLSPVLFFFFERAGLIDRHESVLAQG